jgi:hypothetical protein
MRQRFVIPGDEWEDYAVWLCCGPCSLCQETRTLSSNGVEDGIWPSSGMKSGTFEKPQATATTPPPAVTPPAEGGEKMV